MGQALNLRRQMGSRSFVNPYISNGLVFWLDGIERKQTNEVVWEDLIGGIQFKCADFNTDSITFRGGGIIAKANTFAANPNYTVELVFNGLPQTLILGAGNRTANKICVARGSNNAYSILQYNGGWTCDFSSGNHIISANATTCCEDFNQITAAATANSYGELDNMWSILGRYNSQQVAITMRLYSLRIYDRQLTLAEMMQNQAVDNSRFNLGLTVPE